MYVTFDPENGEPKQEWEFDPEDMLRSEAAAVEKVYGASSEEWVNALRIKNAKARAVLIWHLMRKDHPRLRFEDTPDFRMRQVQIQMSSAELTEIWQQISRTKMDPDMQDAFEAAYNRDFQDALAREGKAVEGTIELASESMLLPKQQ